MVFPAAPKQISRCRTPSREEAAAGRAAAGAVVAGGSAAGGDHKPQQQQQPLRAWTTSRRTRASAAAAGGDGHARVSGQGQQGQRGASAEGMGAGSVEEQEDNNGGGELPQKTRARGASRRAMIARGGRTSSSTQTFLRTTSRQTGSGATGFQKSPGTPSMPCCAGAPRRCRSSSSQSTPLPPACSLWIKWTSLRR